jgi:hypothetical protein
MLDLIMLGMVMFVLIFISIGLAFCYSKFDKWFGDNIDDEDGYSYIESRLSSEFLDPLPRYEPPRSSPPSYVECSQVVSS